MSYMMNNQQRLNDIIFADRNKAYGAYAIRSSYGNTVFRSLSFMLIGVGTVMSLALYLSQKNAPGPEESSSLIIHDSVYVLPVNLPEEEETETAAESPEDPALPENKPEENVLVEVVDSTLLARESSTTAIETNSVPVTEVLTGVPSHSPGGGGGTGGPDTIKVAKAKPKEGHEVDSLPQFAGGLEALYRFISQNLKYPNMASSEGKGGTVYVKFIVDEHGYVGSLNLLNNIGYGMDEEAFRVVSLIPKFKSPAKVKGEPVKVYYQIPIRFKVKY